MKKSKLYLRKRLLSILLLIALLTSIIPTDNIMAASRTVPTLQKHTYSYLGTSNLYTIRNIKQGYKISWSISKYAKKYISFKEDALVSSKDVIAQDTTSTEYVYTLAAANKAINRPYKVTAVVYDKQGRKVATLVDEVRISLDATNIKISNPPIDNKLVAGNSYNFDRKIQPSATSNKTYWVVCNAEDKVLINTKTGKKSADATMKKNGIFTPYVTGTYKISAIAYRDKTDEIQRAVSKTLVITVVAPTLSATPTPTPTLTPTPTPASNSYIPPSSNPTPSPAPVTPVPVTPVPDKDEDGVFDDDEILYGTLKDNDDTDGDTLSDFIELFVLFTDPLIPEANVEGYKDPLKDSDEDGLSDWSEITEHFTFWDRPDSDLDGLSDGDEINRYHTNPTMFDTDGDGHSDGFEVIYELNPNDPSDKATKVVQTLSSLAISDELIEGNIALPSIRGSFIGDINGIISLIPARDIILIDNRLLIGKPVLIDSERESFEDPFTLSFDLSSYALLVGDDNLKNLMICRLSPDGTFLPVTSSVLNETALSCDTNSVGTYFVLDVAEFLTSLGIDMEDLMPAPKASMSRMMVVPSSPSLPPSMSNEPSSEEEIIITPYSLEETFLTEVSVATPSAISGQADIAFIIDTTGSMGNEIRGVIRNITNFVTILASEYDVQVNFALIDFKDLEEDGPDTTIVVKNGASNWYSRVSDFVNNLNTLYASGGGDTPESDIDALETARRLDWRPTASKFAILITDAPYKTYTSYGDITMEEEAARLDADGIITSVITYTGEYSGTYDYSPLWETTGGLFASIYDDFSNTLLALAGMIGEETSDGVWVILKHGYRYIKLPSLPVNNEVDSDGDGITDYNELGTSEILDLTLFIKALLIARGIPSEDILPMRSINVYNAISDPTMPDTDLDGMNDSIDPNPWVYDAVPAIKENPAGTAFVQAQWKELTPLFVNTGARSAGAYDTILNQFDVENNIRYKKDTRNGAAAPGFTWCNIFVWDATIGMNVEIPHFYNPKTGAKATSIKAGEYYEMSATRMTEWFAVFGASYGWHEVTASEARDKANAGLPTVAVATNTGHVQMICPTRGADTDTMSAQAGGTNFRYDIYTKGMGTYHVKFYYHN